MARVVKSSKELGKLDAYQLIKEEELKDCSGYGLLFRHKKTGARVCVISNEDDNKVFYIGFRTPPTDNTGVAHIIEHTVLNGSEKFTPKDPFKELCKGSLNTFLNAMTFSDKTLYPIASCNEKDFTNLMDVYLDAVFHPNIYRREEIFKQEGWHYELNSREDDLTINGIVYSEMKGAFSSPEERNMRAGFSALFPDSEYGFESGGDPDFIPELTYQNFLDFHRKYYHPTNSYIYLYGNLDIEERLNLIDENYLSEYMYQPVASEVKWQEPGGIISKTEHYPLEEGESSEASTYLSYAYFTEKYDDVKKNMACEILGEALFNVPGAPIREALINAGIGQDIESLIMDGIMQPFGAVIVKNTEADRMEEFKQILKAEFKKQIENKVNRDTLLGVINRNEFIYREADGYTPKGLRYGISILETWLYNDDMVFNQLHKNELYEQLRNEIETGYFEEIIEKYMLNSRHALFYTMAPEKGLGRQMEKKLADRLAAYKASLSDEELDRLIEDTENLRKYQEEPSTKEELATIPHLFREDIERKVKPLMIEKDRRFGIEVLLHEYDTNGILYYNLLFGMDKLPERLISYAALLSKLLGEMDTENYSYLELGNEENIYTGGIGTVVSGFAQYKNHDAYKPAFNVSCKVMYDRLDKSFSLVNEQLLRTKLTDRKRIKELLAESCSRMQMYFNSNGAMVAMNRVKSYISSYGMLRELTGGVSYYRFISNLYNNFDSEADAIVSSLQETADILFGRDNLIISVTGDRDGYDRFVDIMGKYISEFKLVKKAGDEAIGEGIRFEKGALNEGLKVSGQVQFVAVAGDYAEKNIEFNGSVKVARKILNNEYLYNNIRVLGGAYGCGCSFNDIDGTGVMYSYRDPKLVETKQIFENAAEYLRSYEADEEEITKCVIGTIGGLDTPLSPGMMGVRSLYAYMSGITEELLQKQRNEVIDTTADDIRAVADMVYTVSNSGNICVVGNGEKLDECKELFNEVRNLC